MTFLHKLSRRLARLKPGMPVAAAAVSAAAAFVGASYRSQHPPDGHSAGRLSQDRHPSARAEPSRNEQAVP